MRFLSVSLHKWKISSPRFALLSSALCALRAVVPLRAVLAAAALAGRAAPLVQGRLARSRCWCSRVLHNRAYLAKWLRAELQCNAITSCVKRRFHVRFFSPSSFCRRGAKMWKQQRLEGPDGPLGSRCRLPSLVAAHPAGSRAAPLLPVLHSDLQTCLRSFGRLARMAGGRPGRAAGLRERRGGARTSGRCREVPTGAQPGAMIQP